MCCIIHRPAGVKMPTYRTFEQIYLHNRDGIGFCTSSGKSWHGFDFYEFLREIRKVRKDEEVIIHMRWATHGSVSTKNCHPFYDEDQDIWFAHNGVLHIHTRRDMTDSETFFRSRFIPLLKTHSYDDPIVWQYVNVERGASRFVFMRHGEVKRLGAWCEFGGCYYSNMNWQF